MRFFLKLVTYFFHPIGVPFWASLLYFQFTPRFFPADRINAELLAIVILTIFIPIVFLFLLKNLRLIQSIHLNKTEDRKFPLLLFIFIIFTVINFILSNYGSTLLYYYFFGILCSCILAAIATLFKKPVSLHAMGFGSITLFLFSLSIVYHLNLTFLLALFVFFTGLVCYSRMALKKQKGAALSIGLLLGTFPQVFLLILAIYSFHKI